MGADKAGEIASELYRNLRSIKGGCAIMVMTDTEFYGHVEPKSAIESEDFAEQIGKQIAELVRNGSPRMSEADQ